MTVINFNFFSGGETERLTKKVVFAVVLWLLALVLFLAAVSRLNGNKALLNDANSVLNAATQLKAYNVSDSPAVADASLTSLTDVINAAGLSDRISQLDSNGGETLVRADRVYPDELEKLISMLSAKGMQISAAEVRAANSNGERLLFIKLSVGGAER
ncbi:MAG: hypothetical protein Q4E34_02100 [Synergistaceae bacterium]|nr:hypothetical protein [Synergistaceae bacterium]